MPGVIRLALADDNLLVREGLEQVLASEKEIDVVASCQDLPALLKAVETTSPDVVVTDIRMPPSQSDEGIQIATLLRQSHPQVSVIVLSQYAEPAYALRLLESGSDGRGYLLKERVHSGSELASAVETVAEGGSVIDPRIVATSAEMAAIFSDTTMASISGPGAKGSAQLSNVNRPDSSTMLK